MDLTIEMNSSHHFPNFQCCKKVGLSTFVDNLTHCIARKGHVHCIFMVADSKK